MMNKEEREKEAFKMLCKKFIDYNNYYTKQNKEELKNIIDFSDTLEEMVVGVCSYLTKHNLILK